MCALTQSLGPQVAVEGMYKEEVVINKESSRSSDLSRTKSATKTMSRFKSQAFLQKYGSAKYREQFGSTQFLGNHGSEAFRRKHKIEPGASKASNRARRNDAMPSEGLVQMPC